MEPMTIICRCEDVSEQEILEAIGEGLHSPEEIKRIKRCGMGHCQGRTCRDLIVKLIARELGSDPRPSDLTTFRPPVIPVPLRNIIRDREPNDPKS